MSSGPLGLGFKDRSAGRDGWPWPAGGEVGTGGGLAPPHLLEGFSCREQAQRKRGKRPQVGAVSQRTHLLRVVRAPCCPQRRSELQPQGAEARVKALCLPVPSSALFPTPSQATLPSVISQAQLSPGLHTLRPMTWGFCLCQRTNRHGFGSAQQMATDV